MFSVYGLLTNWRKLYCLLLLIAYCRKESPYIIKLLIYHMLCLWGHYVNVLYWACPFAGEKNGTVLGNCQNAG